MGCRWSDAGQCSEPLPTTPPALAETFSFELPEAGEEEGGGGGTPGKPAAAAAAADAASHGGKRAKRSEVASPSSSSDRGSDLANNTTSMIPSAHLAPLSFVYLSLLICMKASH